MTSYLIVGLASGLLFGLLDGLINGNPVARRLYAAYRPISRASINSVAGTLIDLAYGLIMAALFLLLYSALPGEAGWLKGVAFALIAWFLRVVMGVASQWLLYTLPASALLYTLGSGLVEMLILGVLYGLTLQPTP